MTNAGRQIAMKEPRLYEEFRLAGSSKERLNEVAVVATAYDSVLCADFTYVSTPITSGMALYRAMDEAGVTDPEVMRRDKDRFREQVLLPNIAAADEVARHMLTFGGAVIAPAAFEARTLQWGQDEYMGLWLDTIERKATRLALVDGWEYSNGGAEEYLQALLMQAGRRDRTDIDIVDARGRCLPHLEAIALMANSVRSLARRGFHPTTLATVLHRVMAIHGMVADEQRYGVMRDTSGRAHVRLSRHYADATPSRSEYLDAIQDMRATHEIVAPFLSKADLAMTSSAQMAPGLVRRDGRTELAETPAMLHRADESPIVN